MKYLWECSILRKRQVNQIDNLVAPLETWTKMRKINRSWRDKRKNDGVCYVFTVSIKLVGIFTI